MEQLMMFRKAAPVPDIKLPQGWFIRAMQPGEGAAWSEICGDEFWKEDEMSGAERWQKAMGNDSCVEIDNVIFVCDEQGKPVATATARLMTADQLSKYPPGENGLGYLHFVAALPICRGKGAGSAVTAAVLNRFNELGLKNCVLNTDDHRLPAIKSYLRLGWLPVVPSEDMRRRWELVLRGLGMESAEAIMLDGSPAVTIIAAK